MKRRERLTVVFAGEGALARWTLTLAIYCRAVATSREQGLVDSSLDILVASV